MTSDGATAAGRAGTAVCLALACTLAMPCHGADATGVELEDLTWTELQSRIAAGATTVLLPLGGTEQNGPHMVLGKHNVRVRALAVRIAQQLGHTVVAPVLAYVPEGRVNPPTEHMRWPGTISVPAAAFEALLDGAARSLRQHGFCDVVLLGDHGGYRASLDRVATRVNGDWARSSGCRVHALPEYYRAATEGHAQLLRARGYGQAEIGSHAGLADTSLLLAIDPRGVRTEAPAQRGSGPSGVSGDPARASAELGRLGTDHIVAATVAAIRTATAHQEK